MVRRISACLIAALCMVSMLSSAMAMSATPTPTRVPVTWGTSAPIGNITCPVQIPSQIGTAPGRASWTDGFPPVTFLPSVNGGTPPFGQDFNGVLCQLSQWTRWYNAGAPIGYDATFSSLANGYPQGAIIAVAGVPGAYWFSEVDNNTSDPDTGGSNWIEFSPINATSRVVTTSGAFTLSCNDSQVGMLRASTPSASSSTLPSCSTAKTIDIQDLAQNFNLFPVTITAPSGQTIAGQASVNLALNGQTAHFTYYPSASTWGCDCINVGVPVGSIQIAAYETADVGYVLADGACLSQTTYAALFVKIGTQFSSADGCTGSTFGSPDLRGRVPAGKDNMGGVAANRITLFDATTIGDGGGSQSSVVQQANLAAFQMFGSGSGSGTGTGSGSGSGSGTATDPGGQVLVTQGGGGQFTSGGGFGEMGSLSVNVSVNVTTTVGVSVSTSDTINSGGSSSPLATLSPVQIVMYEIKY